MTSFYVYETQYEPEKGAVGMREIKFRGKSELLGKWYVGDFITDINEFNRTCDKAYIAPHRDKLNTPIRVVKETVGQFTGLKDKNGVEIYEGDILKVESEGYPFTDNWFGVVKMIDGSYLIENLAGMSGDYLFNETREVEVIANIHENPELLLEVNN